MGGEKGRDCEVAVLLRSLNGNCGATDGDGNEEFRGEMMTDPATKTGSVPVWQGRLLLVSSLDFAPNPILILFSKLLKNINILADTVDRTIKDTK